MKLIFLLCLLSFFVSACTKKKEQKPNIMNPLSQGEENKKELRKKIFKECFASCPYYKEACSEFDSKYEACLSDPAKCQEFIGFNLDKGPALKPDRTCEKVCQQSFWGGKLGLCDANNEKKDYKNGFLKLIEEGKSLSFRSLLFSPTLSAKAKLALQKKIESERAKLPDIGLPEIFVVERNLKQTNSFEIILQKDEVSCLGNSLIDQLIEKQKELPKESSFLSLMSYKDKIINNCKLGRLKFIGQEGIKDSKATITKIDLHFHSPPGGCQFTPPQLRIKFKGPVAGDYIAESSIESISGNKPDVRLLEMVNKYPQLFGTNFNPINAVRGLFSYKNRNFLIAETIGCSDIYEVTDFGLIPRKTSKLCDEQCL